MAELGLGDEADEILQVIDANDKNNMELDKTIAKLKEINTEEAKRKIAALEMAEAQGLVTDKTDMWNFKLSETGSIFDDLNKADKTDFTKAITDGAKKMANTWNDIKGLVSGIGDIQSANAKAESNRIQTQVNEQQKLLDGYMLNGEYQKGLTETTEENLDEQADIHKEYMDALKEQYDNGQISYEEYEQAKTDAGLKNEEENKRIQAEKIATENKLIVLKNEQDKKAYETQQSVARTNAVIHAGEGIMSAFSKGPIYGALSVPIIGAALGAQLGAINSAPPPVPQPTKKFAQGGIVSSPTNALIGEAGEKEAIIPLSKFEDTIFGSKRDRNMAKSGDTFIFNDLKVNGYEDLEEFVMEFEEAKNGLKRRGEM